MKKIAFFDTKPYDRTWFDILAKHYEIAYFEEKLKQARMLAEEITAPVRCRTADPVFDGYVAQNFLDNVMRGGLPYHIGDCRRTPPVYLYSRKTWRPGAGI